MIPEAYIYIYLILCTIFLLRYLNLATIPTEVVSNSIANTNYQILIFLLFLIVWIGFRPISHVFADTAAYNELYGFIKGNTFELDLSTENVIFDNLFNLFGSFDLPISIFFLFIASIYFPGIYLASRKLFPENAPLAFFSYLVGFSTFSYGTNGIKAGAGAVIFLLALAYKDRKVLMILLCLVSVGFHHSMKVVIYAYIIAYIIKNTKLYFYGWIIAAVIATFHISFFQDLFASYGGEKALDYLSGNGNVVFLTGFRLDFMLYSAGPVLVGYLIFIKKGLRNSTYEIWLRMYLLMNSIWMLCMYASFTNRIAYLSWFMYPFVLIYPFYAMYHSKNQLVSGKKVVLYHLYFTWFMEVVYYTLIKVS